MNGTSEPMVTLLGGGDEPAQFVLPRSVVKPSTFVCNALALNVDNDHDDDEEPEGGYEPVDCSRVSSVTLKKIIGFLEHFKQDPMTPISEPGEGQLHDTFEGNVPLGWYRDYVSTMGTDDLSMFYSVRSAANFMHIQPLVLLTNLWLAFQVAGKTVDELHELLRIPKMTEKDKEAVMEEHSWIFDIPTDGAETSHLNPQHGAVAEQ